MTLAAEPIDELLQTAARTGAVPGVVAVVTSPGGVLYEGAAGRRSIDGDVLAGPETTFRIASMTKALTSVAAMQLVERGELGLDQPVVSVLPEFGRLGVLEGFDGDRPRLRPPAGPATVRHLLTHTSGLGYWFTNPDVLRWHEVTGTPDQLSGRRACLDAPLVADPGERWEYGTSTDWLGQVVEAVCGRPLDVQLSEQVFAPLGMADATFRPTAEQRDRMMALHARAADGGLALSDVRPPDEPEIAFGGAGAHATAGDYERFLRCLLRGGELDGERILRSETVETMLSDHLRGAPLPEAMPSAVPRLTLEVPTLPLRQGWGLGFQLVFEDLRGMRRAGSAFWAGLFNCWFWLDPRSGIAGLLMTQVLPFFDRRVVETLVAFEHAAYAELPSPAAA